VIWLEPQSCCVAFTALWLTVEFGRGGWMAQQANMGVHKHSGIPPEQETRPMWHVSPMCDVGSIGRLTCHAAYS
jgi:hypothetical protein